MIAEEFNAKSWGSAQRAVHARKKRAAELKEQGYKCYFSLDKALNTDNNGYIIFAFRDSDALGHIKPVNPKPIYDGWEIVARYLEAPELHGDEVVDQTPETKEEAEYLAGEYRSAYGKNFKVWCRRQRAED